ncbi:FRG domain-containing protein [Phaeospirillum tilakii]|uniref:FRG domain-containing protein n=1 Tax=Phaeospirillum tilakii TaxID=741673 RepID=A0ABW5CES0_9PROT
MALCFYEVDDTKAPDISVEEFLSECLLVPKGFSYRGQGDKNWDLVPSAFRERTGATVSTIERTRRLSYFLNDQQFEIDFKKIIDLAGKDEHIVISDEGGYKTLSMLTFFQHFGIPTPLLDWTESPLIALFMSVFERPAGAHDISIFRYDPTLQPPDVTFQQYEKIPFRRIQTQLGGILFFGTCNDKHIIINSHIYSEYIKDSKASRFIKKLNIRISSKDLEKISEALHNNGFREDMVFPNSLQYITNKIKEKVIG